MPELRGLARDRVCVAAALRARRTGGFARWQRAPHEPGNRTPQQIEEMVLELRREHMRWGPRKLKWVLEQAEPEVRWPAASTIGALLAREGLAMARKKRHRVPPYTQPFAAASQSNRVWCADFKGWFRTEDGTRIDPLTITDAHSRYLLRCQAVEKTDTERLQAIFAAAFGEYGMPEAIRSDNGAPFAARAVNGVSRLSLWWMKLGIRPERIQAGHPEQNPYVAYCTSLDGCGKMWVEAARSWSLMPCCFRGGSSSGS